MFETEEGRDTTHVEQHGDGDVVIERPDTEQDSGQDESSRHDDQNTDDEA
jgi:hypothetical protein